MITRDQLHALAKEKPRPAGMLTAYVDIDQSKEINLNRGFERALRTQLRACRDAIQEPDQLAKFDADAEALESFLKNYTVSERGLMLLSDSSSDRLDVHRLSIPVQTRAVWAPLPYLRPIAEAYDEFERCVVVLCSRDHARLFAFEMGEVDAHAETEAASDVHKFDASGQDKMWSQMHFQRKQDLHLKHHMKAVVEELEKAYETKPFTRLLLAGPDETLAELNAVLPSNFESLNTGVLSLSADADEKEVWTAAGEHVRNWEREEESRLVDELITAAAKGQRAVTALDETFAACLDGRVRRLVYAEDYAVPKADRESLRERLQAFEGDTADSYPSNGALGDDAVDWMIRAVLRQGGEIEQLQGEPAERFQAEASGIGAILRY